MLTPIILTTFSWIVSFKFFCFPFYPPLDNILIVVSDVGRKLYYGSHYKRLQKLKDQYDPYNLFKFPESIELL